VINKRFVSAACAALALAVFSARADGRAGEPTAGAAGFAAAAVDAARAPALPPALESGMSVRDAWRSGGWIMWVLAAGSVFGLALSLYLFWTLRAGQVTPARLLGELQACLRSGDLASARRLCEDGASPLARVALAAFDHVRGAPGTDPALLRADVEAEGMRQAEAIQGETQLLLDVSVIAPMLGLLGTVMGMLKAFGSVATDVASAKPVVLAAGVSQAIVTTIFGLLVAIPAMVAYAFFRRRASRRIAALEAAATSLVTAMTGRFER